MIKGFRQIFEKRFYSAIWKGKQQKFQHYPPDKIGKCEYLTGEEILPSMQSKIIEQTKLTFCALVKAFEKQTKAIENEG